MIVLTANTSVALGDSSSGQNKKSHLSESNGLIVPE